MKTMTLSTLILSIVISIVSASTAMAQEERTANPGEDPNEARSTNSTEGSVSAVGICNECIARMYGATGKGSRLGDDTTYRPSGTSSPDGSSSGNTQGVDGTR